MYTYLFALLWVNSYCCHLADSAHIRPTCDLVSFCQRPKWYITKGTRVHEQNVQTRHDQTYVGHASHRYKEPKQFYKAKTKQKKAKGKANKKAKKCSCAYLSLFFHFFFALFSHFFRFIFVFFFFFSLFSQEGTAKTYLSLFFHFFFALFSLFVRFIFAFCFALFLLFALFLHFHLLLFCFCSLFFTKNYLMVGHVWLPSPNIRLDPSLHRLAFQPYSLILSCDCFAHASLRHCNALSWSHPYPSFPGHRAVNIIATIAQCCVSWRSSRPFPCSLGIGLSLLASLSAECF